MSLSRTLAQTLFTKNISSSSLERVLSKYNLESLLPSIVKELRAIKKSKSTNETLRIETPFALNDEAVKHIKGLLGAHDAVHNISINKDLLAGFRAHYKGVVYDGSVSRALKEFTH